MNKNAHFEKNWEEFMKEGNAPERLSRKELARRFYEFGFSMGCFV